MEGEGGEERSVFGGGGGVIRPCAELRRRWRHQEETSGRVRREDYGIKGGTNRKG